MYLFHLVGKRQVYVITFTHYKQVNVADVHHTEMIASASGST